MDIYYFVSYLASLKKKNRPVSMWTIQALKVIAFELVVINFCYFLENSDFSKDTVITKHIKVSAELSIQL